MTATPNFLAHLLRPTRGGALAVLIVFAVLLSMSANAGLLGIPLATIVTSWFFKYAYVLFDHTVRGFDEPPTLDIDMVNPFNEQRPLALLAIGCLMVAAVKLTQMKLGAAIAVGLAALATLVLPACVAVLGLEGNLLKALYPPALARLLLGVGRRYLLVLAVIAGYVLGLRGLGALNLWLSLCIAAGMFAVLSVFSVLGGFIYDRRHELGLETWASPERTLDRAQRAQVRESEHKVTEAYGKMRVGAHTEAWAILQTWLTKRGRSVEDYRWLSERVTAWGDPRYANRLTEEYVDRLLALKDNGRALDVVARRLGQDPGFRPKSAAATLRVAELAAQGGGAPGVARTLLADFDTRFAGDPCVAAAAALARRLGA